MILGDRFGFGIPRGFPMGQGLLRDGFFGCLSNGFLRLGSNGCGIVDGLGLRSGSGSVRLPG